LYLFISIKPVGSMIAGGESVGIAWLITGVGFSSGVISSIILVPIAGDAATIVDFARFSLVETK